MDGSVEYDALGSNQKQYLLRMVELRDLLLTANLEVEAACLNAEEFQKNILQLEFILPTVHTLIMSSAYKTDHEKIRHRGWLKYKQD